MTKKPGKKEREFCRCYLRSMDMEQAAKEAGFSPDQGPELLESGEVVRMLDRYRLVTARQICSDDVVRRLAELAFGRANDCVRLVLEEEPYIPELKLDLLAELKRGSNGVVEIKLVDRIKALEKLLELLGGTSDEAESFFRALEDAGGMDVGP